MTGADRPVGNAVTAWWLEHVSDAVDHMAVVERVNEEAAWSGHFAFMTISSAGIAVLGLLLSSPAVVIGAMLISPLMGPIIGFGFGLALFDFAEIRRSVQTLAIGIVMAVLICALIVALSPLQTVTGEIAARTRPNLLDLGVAIFAGLAGTYATIRGRHGAIVGVAIAVALMPPLAVVGFGLATFNLQIFSGAAFLFVTNLMAIGFSAAVLARLYGFASRLSPRQNWLQASLILGIFVAFAIPLGLALRQIAWEALASRQAHDVVARRFGADARIAQLDMDFAAQPIRVGAVVFTPETQPGAAGEVSALLEMALDQPVQVDIEQVRVGSAAVELSQAAPARIAAAERNIDRMAEQLMIAAGVGRTEILIDRERQIARARAVPLPGASLSAYRQIEARVAANSPGWTIMLVPPAVPLPQLSPESDDDQGALETIAWAAQRREARLGVSGEEAEAVADRLREAGIDAAITEDGPEGISWLVNDDEQPGT